MEILIALYFLPVLVALGRQHKNIGPIIVVDLFLGWTFIGWIVAFAWAFSSQTKDTH
jgi:hypothetical protein